MMAFRADHLPLLLEAATPDPEAPQAWGVWKKGAIAPTAELELDQARLVMISLDGTRNRRHVCITAAGLHALAQLHPAARQLQAA